MILFRLNEHKLNNKRNLACELKLYSVQVHNKYYPQRILQLIIIRSSLRFNMAAGPIAERNQGLYNLFVM